MTAEFERVRSKLANLSTHAAIPEPGQFSGISTPLVQHTIHLGILSLMLAIYILLMLML